MSMRSLRLALSLSFFISSCASWQHQPKNYVSLDLPYPPYQTVLQSAIKTFGPLKSRGEAHLTIITPPEFKALLNYMPASEIQNAAETFFKTRPTFKHICLGRSQIQIESKPESTYYVVLQEQNLLQFRQQLVKGKHIPKSVYDPDLFFPHITIGFTNRDLHYEDGVRKNSATCLKNFKLSI